MVRRIIFLTLICFTGAGAAQAQTPPPPPPSRIAFGDGTWANLTPVFAQGKSVKLFSDNAAQATAVITLWVSSEGKQDWKIGPCDPTNPKIDKTVNQGKRAGGKAKRFTKPKTLIAAMKKENVPPSLQPWFLGELKNGREINRLVIQAPDDGHYASFKLSYSSPKLRVLGRGLVDRPAKGRVYVEPRIAKAVPTPKPPRKKTREEILIEKGLLSKPTPPKKTPASKTTSPPKTAPETKTPRAYAWHDGGWVSLTPDGRLLYNGLPAGRYVIQGKNGKHIITGMPGGPEKLTLWRKSQRLVGPHPRYGNDFV